MIHEWFQCPVCDADGDSLTIGIDGEHITLACLECQSRVKQWHSDFQAFLDP